MESRGRDAVELAVSIYGSISCCHGGEDRGEGLADLDQVDVVWLLQVGALT